MPGKDIDDGGVITEESTTTNVELDQFFSIFDRPTRKALSEFYKGGERAYSGQGAAANRGLAYLSPQLAASTRLFAELRNEPPVLRRFLIDSERLVTGLADRRDDLAALIGNLNATTQRARDPRRRRSPRRSAASRRSCARPTRPT